MHVHVLCRNYANKVVHQYQLPSRQKVRFRTILGHVVKGHPVSRKRSAPILYIMVEHREGML